VPPPLQKSLGQHHLISGALCRPLVEFLRPGGARVVEIGAGGGVLTAELLAAGAASIIAWEVDPAWAFALRGRLPDGRLAVVAGDALDLDWRRLALAGGEPPLVAGNLPYQIATVLVERLLTGAAPPAPGDRGVVRAAFLVQREVAERLTARPRDSAYGALSVLVAAHAEARLLGRLRPGSFRPPPKVESAFVGLSLKPPPLPPAEMPALLATVRAAFGQRRKTLRNALGAAWGRPAAAAALAAAGIPPGARAEELGLAEFLALEHGRGAVDGVTHRPV
jgi:16S rRNA (adenine1518-N6/adenine1519-N6)-dimethyltransferase